MTLTPDYGVFYRDGFHEAGRPFEILPEDAEEMAKHGKLEGVRQEAIEVPAPAPKPKTRARAKK